MQRTDPISTTMRRARRGAPRDAVVHELGPVARAASRATLSEVWWSHWTAWLANTGARLRYGRLYEWYAILGVLDIALTWTILRLGGMEANWIAAQAEQAWGLWGLIAIKSSTVAAVVLIAEYIGRRRPSLGLGLALSAVLVSIVPVVVGWSHLATLAEHAQRPEYWALLWYDMHGML